MHSVLQQNIWLYAHMAGSESESVERFQVHGCLRLPLGVGMMNILLLSRIASGVI